MEQSKCLTKQRKLEPRGRKQFPAAGAVLTQARALAPAKTAMINTIAAQVDKVLDQINSFRALCTSTDSNSSLLVVCEDEDSVRAISGLSSTSGLSV